MKQASEVSIAENKSESSTRWLRIASFVGFALLSPFVTDAMWGRPLQFFLLGLILWLNPPRRSLSAPVNLMLLALIAIAAVVYLPAGWFGSLPWRESALRVGISLGDTFTPQPWLTMDGILDLLAGISWGYLLFAQRWSIKEHQIVAQWFSLGVLLIIVVSILINETDASISFWKNERDFGPFENRNHTANLFAIGGIMMLGCAYAMLRRSKVVSVLWCVAAVVAVFGVVISYSRAGVLLLIGGALVWVLLLAFVTRDRVPIAMFAALGISLGTLFLIKGGETLDRFKLETGVSQPLLQDFRWLLYKDVLLMTSANPWCGVGLGNFADIFPQYRKASLSEARAVHPDSDWAMLHAEMGFIAVILVSASALLVMRNALPLRHGTNVSIRAAALTGSVCFVLHGFANVSGHVLGTVIPALLVGSLAINPKSSLRYWRGTGVVFRTVGLCIGIAGAASILMFWGFDAVPGRTAVAVLKKTGRQQYATMEWDKLGTLATRGTQIAPLDWEFYYLRGTAAALGQRMPSLAQEDFRRARHLYPNSWRIAFQQGLVFLPVDPMLAVEPWKDALNRAADVPPELFQRMLDASRQHPELHAAVRQFATSDMDRLIVALQQQAGKEFEHGLQEIRERDPGLERLTPEQKERLLAAWASRGNREKLLEQAGLFPSWKPLIWTVLANDLAQKGAFQKAVEVAREFVTPPPIPELSGTQSLEDLQRQFVLNKQDVDTGYQLFQAQRKAGLAGQALSTLTALTALPECPPYVYYLQAQLHAENGAWREAWAALALYDKRLQIPQSQRA